MKIRFENSIDDFVALARYHNDHSPAARRVRVRMMWVCSIAGPAAIAWAAMRLSEEGGAGTEEGQLFIAFFVAILLGVFLVGLLTMPGRFRRIAERQARRAYAEGSNKSVLGPRELELVGNELVARSSYAESRVRLEAIERVVTYEGYTFIFVNAVSAHVIPHAAVSEGDPEQFTAAIQDRLPSVSTDTHE